VILPVIVTEVLLEEVGMLSLGNIQAMKVYERLQDTEHILDPLVLLVKRMSRVDILPIPVPRILRFELRVIGGGELLVADEAQPHLFLLPVLK
jgi:hypothetical protein